MLEATPSPSGGTSRTSTPPVNTTPDVVVPPSSTGTPSPAGVDTPSSADTGPTQAKRPRLRSTKSELFIVQSEPSRDTADADRSSSASPAQGSSNAGRTVATVVAAVSDDSVDSNSVADLSQNSLGIGSTETQCQTSTEFVVSHFSSASVESNALQVCRRLL